MRYQTAPRPVSLGTILVSRARRGGRRHPDHGPALRERLLHARLGAPAGMLAWLVLGWGAAVLLAPRRIALPRRRVATVVALAAARWRPQSRSSRSRTTESGPTTRSRRSEPGSTPGSGTPSA